jgi:moderate conductance mechanosensitive channel
MNLSIFFASPVINGLLTGGIVFFLIFMFIFEHHILKKHEENLKKLVIIGIYTLSFILLFAGVIGVLLIWGFDVSGYLAGVILSLGDIMTASIGRLVSSTVILFIALLILRISKITTKRIGMKPSPNQRRKRTIARVTRSITKYVVWITCILSILAVWGVNIAPALAGLGILGLVIGLGAQRFINDLIAGFFIIFEHHFDVGDKIEVRGFKGEVIDIGLKTTKIRNWKGEILILANGEVSSLVQFSKEISTAAVEFGIAYQEDIQTTIDLLNLELPKMRVDFPEIVEDPKVLGVINLSNSSVDMRAICKTLNEQHYAVEREMRKRIKLILDANGIEIPFPQVVINQPTVRKPKPKKEVETEKKD